MNTKKSKHKKPNKPPNPNPPQSSENAAKSENVAKAESAAKAEDVQNQPETQSLPVIDPKSEVKELQKVSDIQMPVCEKTEKQEVVASDTPMKPKRNKGKKKKQDDDNKLEDELVDKTDKNQNVPKDTDVEVTESEDRKITEENITEDIKTPVDETSVAPSRKKKNKKKNHDKNLEDVIVSDVAPVTAPEESKTIVAQKVDPEIKELASKPDTPKQDKKKKNKNKNLNDSERSDKSEEQNVSCTTAFQQILVDDENASKGEIQESVISNPEELNINREDNKESIENITSNVKPEDEPKHGTLAETKIQETKTQKEENKSKKKNKKGKQLLLVEEENITKLEETEQVIGTQVLPISEIKEEVKEPQVIEARSKEDIILANEDGHSKKKNKKNKKQPQVDLSDEVKAISKDEPAAIIDKPVEKLEHVDLKPILMEPVEKVLEAVEREPSPKPKAKIAKPVEKKKKGNQDLLAELIENVETSESIGKKIEDKNKDEKFKIKSKDIPLTNVIECSAEESNIQEVAKILPEPGKINIPEDNNMGKKRKKSPKPPKSKSKTTQEDIHDVSQKIDPKAEIIQESLETTTPILLHTEPKPVTDQTLSEYINIDKYKDTTSFESSETLKKETSESTKESNESVTVKENEGFEVKTNKKKKKTPKLPAQTAEIAKSVNPIKLDDNQVKTESSIEEKLEIPLDLSFSSEIEVRSVRTDESEGSTCEATPEVHFIRSSSQQLFDSNNNTVIQELVSADETKLDDPITIPLVEGSGATPLPTPGLISSTTRSPEFEAKSSTEEKTDLKSKMMEVNQDMEELRLSIERSLAEFTALDKSEEELKKGRDNKSPRKIVEHSLLDKKEEKFIPPESTTMTDVKKDIIPVELDIKEPEKLSLEAPSEASHSPPVCPARKDHKGKGKSKKKGKQETDQSTTTTSPETTSAQAKDSHKEEKQKTDKCEQQKSESTQEKGKQQSASTDIEFVGPPNEPIDVIPVTSEHPSDELESVDFEPIDNFEDALTSSIDDVNKTFEMIAEDADKDNEKIQKELAANKPDINITGPKEDTDTKRNEKTNPVSQPKNLLGHYDIPVQSNKTDYKKEKNKTPNARQAKVKIKDSTDIETKKQSKESQTDTKKIIKSSDKTVKESFSKVRSQNEEFVYKYSFRKVFLQSACHVCNKDLSKVRVPCSYCSLVFYCSARHKDEDWPQHQALCFAVSTLAHMKDQKHIYADAQLTTGQDYRLLRMQMIVSAEKVLKRRLVPWEQEALLYPRMCADVACREWRQGKLRDCGGCGQLSYCAAHPDHLANSHQRWCKSYCLYQKLVTYQQTRGRLEPKLPTKVMVGQFRLPGKMNEVLASMYEEKIDMNDIQYAALTQLATAPLTTAYCLQLHREKAGATNGVNMSSTLTIHVVNAELQFEADGLHKWEVFFLHVRPELRELRVVLLGAALNPAGLPLELLARIKLCENCRQNKRRVVFNFEDNKNYFEYRTSESYVNPDVICAFNPSIQRSSIYNGKDPWPASITSILKLKKPFIITSYTITELRKDIARVRECSGNDFKMILEPCFNSFASVRPDRNFISDDEMPLLFKNYCVAVIVGC